MKKFMQKKYIWFSLLSVGLIIVFGVLLFRHIESQKESFFVSKFLESSLKIKNTSYFEQTLYEGIRSHQDILRGQLIAYNDFIEKNGLLINVKTYREDEYNYIRVGNDVYKAINYHFRGVFSKNENLRFGATLIEVNGEWYFYGFAINE